LSFIASSLDNNLGWKQFFFTEKINMSYFPASHSLLSETHLISFLENKYSLKSNFKCKLIKTWVNDTYLIINELEQFVFRVYRYGWRDKSEIQAEVDLILMLKEKDISVSSPIADKAGNYIQVLEAIEGVRMGVMFHFANGEKPKSNSNEVAFLIGEYMAQFHQQTVDLKIPRIEYSIKFLLDHSIEKIGKKLNQLSPEFLFLKKFQQYFYEVIEKLKLKKFRKGVVHFDLWRDNIHVSRNLFNQRNKITLFDFDFCGNGWLILDLAFYEIINFITEPNQEKYKKELVDFRKGYENVIEIKEEEKDAIPLLATCTLIYYLSFQSERFEAVYANDDYIKLVINQRIKRWIKYCNLPISSVDIS